MLLLEGRRVSKPMQVIVKPESCGERIRGRYRESIQPRSLGKRRTDRRGRCLGIHQEPMTHGELGKPGTFNY